MKKKRTKNIISPQPSLDIIEGIKAGEIKVKDLSIDQRMDCVEVLVQEGFTTPVIAKILNRSDRTIKRYKQKIREKNVVRSRSGFTIEHVGMTLDNLEANINRLMRISRDPKTPPKEQILAERTAAEIALKRTKMLQSIGYLRQAEKEGLPEYVKLRLTEFDKDWI